MEVRRVNPENGFINEFTEFRDRVKSLETRPAGNKVIRGTLTTTDPVTGVSTVFGQLPDGSVGLEQWVNDTTAPAKPSTPSISSGPGTITLSWDGLDYLGADQPKDYHHTNVEMSVDNSNWDVYSEFRGNSVLVVSDQPAGATRYFRLVSLDYNGNQSVPSATVSGAIVSLVNDASIQQSINDVATTANNANSTANTALTSANGKNKVYYQTAQPTGGTYQSGDTWFDTDDGNKVYVYNGSTWTATTFGPNAIADLAITNAKIADATIQSAKIAAIDAGKITAGTLDANRIGARTITVSKLAVADFENLVPISDIQDPDLRAALPLTAPFSYVNNSTISPTTTRPWMIKLSATIVDYATATLGEFRVQPGDQLYFEWEQRRAGATQQAGLALTVYKGDGTVAAYDVTPVYPPSAATDNTWVTYSGAVTIPADGYRAVPILKLYTTSDMTGDWYFGRMYIRRMAGGNLIVDGAISATKLSANSVAASAIQANAVDAAQIKAGAITAAKLEAQLVLASEIVAGPVNDTHASMKSDGFRVYAKDQQTGQVNEVVRLGVANTDDYFAVQKSDGTYAATISQSGIVSGVTGNFKNLVVDGKTISNMFNGTGRGLVAWGQFNGNQLPASIANGQEKGLFELAFVPDSSRMYAVFCSPVLFTPTGGTATAAAFRARFTSDGTQPTTGSTILAEDFKPILVNGSWTNSYQINGRLIGGFNGSYIRILFTMAASNGAGLTTELGQSPTFWVMDIGPAYPQSGVLSTQVSGGGTSAPVKATYTKYYAKVNQRSFDGAGNFYNYDVGRAYQGLQPGTANGDMRSMIFFGDMTADLSGATINDMQVYVYFDHWYYNSGGTARIGVHGWTGAPPSAFGYAGGGWILDSAGWPKPGGRWLTIPSAYWAGFQSGAYRGITLGVNSNSYTYYGIASDCQIYVQYTK